MALDFLKHFRTRATPQTQPIPGLPMVANSAGGYSFAVDDWKRLERFLILGSEGGSKRTTLEGGIRVPFAVQWKGHLPAGTVYDQPVIQLDILPTALAAAGAPVGRDAKLDGVDLLPDLAKQKTEPPHDTLYWRLGEQMAIRRGDWKLVRYDDTADRDGAVSLRPFRPGITPARLYNLRDDIGEAHDLSAEHADKARELQQAWEPWSKQLARPSWGPGSVATQNE